MKQIKEHLLKSIEKELLEHQNKIWEECLEEWKNNTLKAGVLNVLKDLSKEEREELLNYEPNKRSLQNN